MTTLQKSMLVAIFACALTRPLRAAPADHPAVSPGGSGEPELAVVLKTWGLDVDRDLRNPLREGEIPAGLFIKADKDKPVTLTPLVALGMETPTHAGWYPAGPKAGDLPADPEKAKVELWTYAYKQPQSQWQSGAFTPPPLASGDVNFDPGLQPFGLWVSNENFKDGGVFTQPGLVARVNQRLAAQPYKAMIFPTRDPKGNHLVANSYIVTWEYSTNDDFQDVIERIDNVRLLPPDPLLKGLIAPNASVKKLATDFAFVEGPAWDLRGERLCFSDIPRSQIVGYKDGRTSVVNGSSGQSNGLMFDRDGLLVRCEGGARRLSRGPASEPGTTIVDRYQGKRLNSPNDLWIDPQGGIYFTDPRYGARDDMELDKEAVYYVDARGRIKRIIDDLVRPNGLAIAPTGDWLYVLDNGADTVHRYRITAPGELGRGQRIAYVRGPDGMAVDAEGRLWVTSDRGIAILRPDGGWLGLIEMPEQPANCKFGGKDSNRLFMTARTSLYAIDTDTSGWLVHLDGVKEGKRKK